MSDTKISEPAPNCCRTCGRRPNDPMAALCLDTHHRTLERIHPQPAEQAEQQGVGITADWVLGYLNTDAPEDSRDAIRNAFTEWNALAATGKQQAIAEFLKERDEALGCPDATDAERAESARLIAALAARQPKSREDLIALAREAIRQLDVIDGHIDAAVENCKADLAARQPGAVE